MDRDEDDTRKGAGPRRPEEGERGPASRDIPTGRFSRFMKLSALSAGASTRYFGQKVKGFFQEPEARAESLLKTHLETARKTVEVMGNLKGAVMKVGQMISLHPENGLLPTELTALFNSLQSEAPTLPWPSIREQLERELNGPPEQLFAWIDEQPLAAASLGQVHAARLKSGEEVVVKVQYPGIDRTVESDLWQVRTLFKASGLVGRAEEAELIFNELRDRLHEELDYELEARNQQEFRAFFANDRRLLIPRHIPELSTRRVLTMERLEGQTLEAALARHHDQAWRNALGRDLFDLLLIQLIDFRRLHADPQLGNFRFLDDGRIIMLDLGCVKSFDEPFVDPYVEMIRAGLERDHARMASCLAALGIVPEDDREAVRLTIDFADIVLEPLKVRPYRFDDSSQMMHELKAIGPKFLAYPQIQGHPDLVFLHRTYAGIYFMLTKLKAEADWRAIFEERYAGWRARSAR